MSSKETDEAVAARILRLKIRLDTLQQYALDTAIELGDVFAEALDRTDYDWDATDTWLDRLCPGVEQAELAMFDEIALAEADGKLDGAKSISDALTLIDEAHAQKEQLSGQ